MRNFARVLPRVVVGCMLVAGAFVSVSLMRSATSQEVAVSNDDKKEERIRPYCDGWGKPAFAFFITGRQHGYIEPCGCTGLDSQKGGLARRETLYRDLKKEGGQSYRLMLVTKFAGSVLNRPSSFKQRWRRCEEWNTRQSASAPTTFD